MKKDRFIAVAGEPGNYYPVFLSPNYPIVPLTWELFEIHSTRLELEDMTPGELIQYAKILETMPKELKRID